MEESLTQFGEKNLINGIITHPDNNPKEIGVILLNAGFLHKVGPNRIYVRIARKLAQDGYTALRFDFSGIGDSYSSNKAISSTERKESEIKNSIDYLSEKYNIRKIVLLGFCSGADAASSLSGKDKRIVALILINGYFVNEDQIGQVYTEAQQNLQRRYYKDSFLKLNRLKRLITGKSNYKDIAKSLSGRKQTGQNFILDNWKIITTENDLSVLIVCSTGSVSYDIYQLYLKKYLEEIELKNKIIVEIIDNTDHMFTLINSQNLIIDKISNFIKTSVS